jgi:hypothetical protein
MKSARAPTPMRDAADRARLFATAVIFVKFARACLAIITNANHLDPPPLDAHHTLLLFIARATTANKTNENPNPKFEHPQKI